jgi:hypothetical protein
MSEIVLQVNNYKYGDGEKLSQLYPAILLNISFYLMNILIPKDIHGVSRL